MKNPLTSEHKQMLKNAGSALDEAKDLAKRCRNCKIDTADMDQIISELEEKATLLLQNFFPPIGDQSQL